MLGPVNHSGHHDDGLRCTGLDLRCHPENCVPAPFRPPLTPPRLVAGSLQYGICCDNRNDERLIFPPPDATITIVERDDDRSCLLWTRKTVKTETPVTHHSNGWLTSSDAVRSYTLAAPWGQRKGQGRGREKH